jgi:glycosyltransferase involved in cell wall biosynthesis
MKLNVIVPSYNESQNVPYFYGRARQVLEALPGIEWNLVFINNSSDDDTLEQVMTLRASDPRVKIITLSRNFGYHAALVAGLSSVDGDLYAIVDVDCEDPPELLADFLKGIQDGAQVAYGVRSNRDEPALITFGRKLFYLANRGVADSEIVMWMGEFSMFTRQVRDAILAPRTTFVSVRAEMGYVGFRRIGIPYRRAKRQFGETHYNLWRMTIYAILSILSGTTFPLRLIVYLAALIGAGFPVYVWAMGLSAAQAVPAAAFASLYFLVVAIPLISLYLARVYKNQVLRPMFIIDRTRTVL